MPPLPVELVEEVIGIVAECCPESLPNCALVSRQWIPRSTYHLYRIFRAPTITTSGALQAFADIVEKHPRLAALATSLQVAPDPESAYTSYIPFHRLSSRVLPNVHHLVLGNTLRWGDYPVVYRKGIAGFFSEVVALDLSCHFSSVSDLFRVVRSFKDVQDVRLIYPHHVPPRWIVKQPQVPRRRRGLSSQMAFKLQNLELSLVILKPVLDVCGDSVVNLSVLCPQMSAVSMDAVEGGKPLALACSLTSLQTVKIRVPVESDDPTDGAGLDKLQSLLIAPIGKPDIRYSLSLVRCREHDAVGYRVEGISAPELRRTIQTSAKMDQLEDCQECYKRSVAALALEDTSPDPEADGKRRRTLATQGIQRLARRISITTRRQGAANMPNVPAVLPRSPDRSRQDVPWGQGEVKHEPSHKSHLHHPPSPNLSHLPSDPYITGSIMPEMKRQGTARSSTDEGSVRDAALPNFEDSPSTSSSMTSSEVGKPKGSKIGKEKKAKWKIWQIFH